MCAAGSGVSTVALAATTVRELHDVGAWVVIAGNGVAGAWALAANWLASLRTRALWWFVVLAEVSIFVQAGLGAGIMRDENVEPAEFHVFYGFVAIIAVGILYSYRSTSPWVREHSYLVYGLGSLFLMGLGIRALLL